MATGHTATAVAKSKSGYFAELDKAIGPKSATTAVSDFIAGKSTIDTLMSNLTTAAAEGDRIDFASSALEDYLLNAGYSTPDVKRILAQITKIKNRTAGALKSADESSQIKTALMAQRQENVPKLQTAEQTYVQLIRNTAAEHKRERRVG